MFGGADAAGGVGGGMEDFGDDGFFGGAEGVDGDFLALLDAGVGEGHAPGVFLRDEVGCDEVVFDGEGGGVGEEGGCMAVFADAEHDEVEEAGAEVFFDERFVVGGVLFEGRFFRLHAEDLVGGDGEAGEAALHGGVVVAVWVGWGDGALVAPEEEDFGPVDGLGHLGEEAIDGVGRGAAGEGDGKAAVLRDCTGGLGDPVLRGKAEGLVRCFADGEVAAVVEGAL